MKDIDKIKLLAFSESLKMIYVPEIRSLEGAKILKEIVIKIEELTNFIDEKSNEL